MKQFCLIFFVLIVATHAFAQQRSEQDFHDIEKEFGQIFYDDLMSFRPRIGASEYLYTWFNIGRAVSVRNQALKDILEYHNTWLNMMQLKESEFKLFELYTTQLHSLEPKIEQYFLLLPKELRRVESPFSVDGINVHESIEQEVFDRYLESLHETYLNDVPSEYNSEIFYRDLKLFTRFHLVRMLSDLIQKHQITDVELAQLLQDFSEGKRGFLMSDVNLHTKLNFKDGKINVEEVIYGQVHETFNVIVEVCGLSVEPFTTPEVKRSRMERLLEPYQRSEADITKGVVRSQINEVLVRAAKP